MANPSIKRNSKKNTRVRTAKNRYAHQPVDSLEKSTENTNEDYSVVPDVENDDNILGQISSFSEEEKEDIFEM